jgi:hypothetical protein
MNYTVTDYLRKSFLELIHLTVYLNKNLMNYFIELNVGDLVCVWILYLKVISRIFIHRMHSVKNPKYLVGILKNAKYFANSHF